jgi:hypothetical protein
MIQNYYLTILNKPDETFIQYLDVIKNEIGIPLVTVNDLQNRYIIQ